MAAYPPHTAVELFDALYFLSRPLYDEDIGFFVAWVALREGRGRRVRRVWPRIFYKDLSLVWRVGTHLVREEDDNWIGKGDLKWERNGDGEEVLCSAEETTNLPLEIQGALDDARGEAHPRRDPRAVPLVLRRAPPDRVEPYADFTTPRRRAAERHRIHRGRRVARFLRRNDPSSLRFARGYEPDFARGVLEVTRSASDVYGGEVCKYRVLSKNREVQYPFVATPTHVWMNPPQALTTELSTYGVRTVDVAIDEEAFVPGFEYHFDDTDGALHSQIPDGYAGDPHPDDEHRADASAWIEALPVIRRFRERVLARR